jgi:mitochondrial import receptor subunit TOM40
MQAGQTMVQLEHDYSGLDYTLNAKIINPSPMDGSGIYVGSYLQSVSKKLALGIETLYQRAALDQTEMSSSYLAKLTGADGKWIATAQFQPIGVLQATYWHKLSEKVEAAADLQVIAAPMRRDAIGTIGTKYDLRMSTFRAQLDSTGKVSALLEQRFAPSFAFTVAGEIDHFKVRVTFLTQFYRMAKYLNLSECCEGRCRRDDREHKLDARGDGNGTATGTSTFLGSFTICRLIL